MPNIPDHIVREVLLSTLSVPKEDADAILQMMIAKQELQKESKPKPSKKPFVIVLHDPEGKLPKDLMGWIIQTGETQYAEDHVSYQYRKEWGLLELDDILCTIGKGYKRSPREKKLGSLTCVGDIFAFAKPSDFKKMGVLVKTKDPVPVIVVNPDKTQWAAQAEIDQMLDDLGVKKANKKPKPDK